MYYQKENKENGGTQNERIFCKKAGTKHTAIAVQSDGYDYARYAARVRLKANRYMDKEKGGGSL